MIDSNNIEIIRDNLKELDQKIENLDVEIPPHTSGDAGKYLGVDSSGDLEFSDPLPAATEASAGDVLGLVGVNKDKGWVTPFNPPAYSENETATGQKWIDGKEIYFRSISGDFGEITGSTNVTIESNFADTLVNTEVILIRSNGIRYANNVYVITTAGQIVLNAVTTPFNEGSYVVTIFYTKATPTRDDDTSTKKKKSK